jgi:hypothetical protein
MLVIFPSHGYLKDHGGLFSNLPLLDCAAEWNVAIEGLDNIDRKLLFSSFVRNLKINFFLLK